MSGSISRRSLPQSLPVGAGFEPPKTLTRKQPRRSPLDKNEAVVKAQRIVPALKRTARLPGEVEDRSSGRVAVNHFRRNRPNSHLHGPNNDHALRRTTTRARIRIARKCRRVRKNSGPLPAQRRKRHMPRLAWRGMRFARPRRAVTPISGLVVHVKEAQKVTPCNNYLAETKPPTGFFARQGVSPSHATLEPAARPSDHRSSSRNAGPHKNQGSVTGLLDEHAACFVKIKLAFCK